MSSGKVGGCPICGSLPLSSEAVQDEYNPTMAVHRLTCPRCGVFQATNPFFHGFLIELHRPQANEDKIKINLSSWLREKSDYRERNDPNGAYLTLYPNFLTNEPADALRAEFEASVNPTFTTKGDKLLLAIHEASKYDGETICAFTNEKESLAWEARAWAQNEKEFDTILNHLREEGLVEFDPRTTETAYILNVKLTGKGLKRVEKLKTGHNHSAQGFGAMWFVPKIEDVYWSAAARAIKKAGYNPLKINDKPSPERIDGQIEVEIANSRFVVADLTGERGGVYYEAGFARGLKVPVIWTCHEDDFKKRHFDIQQFNCIKWTEDELEQLEKKLALHIEEICGPGPNK